MPSSNTTAATPAEVVAAPTHNDTLEVDDGTDSTYGDGISSDITSLSSLIVRGIVENDCRYQAYVKAKTGDLPMSRSVARPCYSLYAKKFRLTTFKQAFESMNLSHSVYLTLDSKEENPLFGNPMGDNPQNILDLGTGDANWTFHVAASYPSTHVTSVDL